MAGRWNHGKIVVVEVPLARESKPRINYQCHSYSGAVKNRVVQETWNGTGKSAVSSLVRMSTGSQLPVAVDLARLLAYGLDT
jgi:hypothetical protein